MNPIEIFYSWQALVVAGIVYGLTQLIKTVVQLSAGPWIDASAKRRLVVKRLLLPAVPPVLGALVGALLPLHPDVLIIYVGEHVHETRNALGIFAAWGACVGQFADYGYSKITDALRQKRVEVPDA